MENSDGYNSKSYQRSPLHSQICASDSTDFIYRKAYKGDWGHWDDLPDAIIVDQNSFDLMENDTDTIHGNDEILENF